MAEVYLARRRAAGIEKWLVVKRMRPERSGDPRFLDLFVREARLSMSLVHQNIVPVFDFGRIDDEVFLAMERVEGRDLGSSLARAATHRMPPLLAAFVAAECCQALDYAHQRKGPDGVALGIVHRDVTPRNVLLSWSGEVKLTDFGIAALAGEATARLLGTPQYMAPEQARSEAIDPRADIYAVGLVLREALSGTRSRPGADRDAILDAARRGALLPWPHGALPDPPSDVALGSGDHSPEEPAPEPPPALVAIVSRATSAAAGDRYPDARSMLEELDHYIVGERARHKAGSPARQLAAWLAGVWESEREEAELDAAIEADHLVSFLDDGAFDVIGTGTVRSLAATAADDIPLSPHAASTPLGAPAPTGESGARRTRMSSSETPIVSGSIQTGPSAGPVGDAARRTRRSLAPVAGVVLGVGVLAAIVALRVGAGERDRASTGASAVAPSAQPAPTAPPAAPPPATPPPAPPPTTPPPIAAPPPDSTATARPSAPARPTSSSPARPASATRPGSGHPANNPPRQNREPVDAGIASTPAIPADAGAARAATCRVRINLTPWAYYTADHDPTRHETPGTIDLTPGPHRLHVWNPELHIERDITINVPADRDTMTFSEPLQPSVHPDAGPLSQP
jgi:serine/threonine protein kinase